jgi:hypothetical protein
MALVLNMLHHIRVWAVRACHTWECALLRRRWYFQQLIVTLDYLHQKQPGVVWDIRIQDLLLMVGAACA